MDKNSEINKINPDMTAEYSRVLDMLNLTAAERDAAIARAEAAEAQIKELKDKLSKVVIIRIVKHEPQGYEAIYLPDKQKIIIHEKSTLETLRHEFGHHTIKIHGGSCAEQEMYDDYDCEGLSFVDFAQKVDDLTFDLSEQKTRTEAAEARVKELEAERDSSQACVRKLEEELDKARIEICEHLAESQKTRPWSSSWEWRDAVIGVARERQWNFCYYGDFTLDPESEDNDD